MYYANVNQTPNWIKGMLNESRADGILGLGGGSMSVMSQSGGLIGGMFSYCLGNSTTGGGWLEFRRINVSKDSIIKWAKLIHNVKRPSLYYIDLVGLLVGGEVLDILGDTFQLNEQTGEGGKMGNVYVTVDGVFIFDTCYDMGGVDLDTAQMPNVSFNFLTHGFDPTHITQEARNVLRKVDYPIYCLQWRSHIVGTGFTGIQSILKF
ncbi:hypothetical protein CASFOL_039665 [Castilleja foliolosa]|uniref:Xylanase inhibitor N-terminal domain-containing protein n=1 Tax=Castilleja foliolosa TaxID=1961234 RepID=A0ABD3BFU8_9LAMI